MMANVLKTSDHDERGDLVAPFDYGALPPEQVTIVQTAANLIRRQLCKTIGTIIEAGQHLKQVKAILGHGSFGQWLATEFGMTPRTAERYIRMATVAPYKIDTVSHLPVGLLHKLAAPPFRTRYALKFSPRRKKGRSWKRK